MVIKRDVSLFSKPHGEDILMRLDKVRRKATTSRQRPCLPKRAAEQSVARMAAEQSVASMAAGGVLRTT